MDDFNRLERFIINAPFWLRVLIVLFGIGVIGLIFGSVDAVISVLGLG